jgi:hypothetical protein
MFLASAHVRDPLPLPKFVATGYDAPAGAFGAR